MADDYSANISTAGTISVGGSQTGVVNFDGDNDWYRVWLVGGRQYVIDQEGSPTGKGTLVDTYLRGVYTSGGNFIVGTTDDDGAISNNSRLYFSAQNTGYYYISAGGFPGDLGSYTLSIADAGAAGDDFAANVSTTGVVAVGGSQSGHISTGFDEDWFKVSLSAGQTYTIDLKGAATGQGTLEDPLILGVYTNSGSLIPGTHDDDSGTDFDSRLSITAPTSGDYYIVAAGSGGVVVGSYQLSVSAGGWNPGTPAQSGAVPVGNSVPLTGTDFIDGILQGSSWQLGPSRVITYSLSDTQYGTWAPADRALVAGVFQTWANVADITFQEISDGGEFSNNSSDITIIPTGNLLDAYSGIGIFPDPALANQFLSAAGLSRDDWPTLEGDILLDNFDFVFQWSQPGGAGYWVLLHEIGHALGLKHTHDNGGNDRPTYSDLGLQVIDNTAATVMSYNPASADPSGGHPGTPMLSDIGAIQAIYGANTTFNSGDNVYRLENDNVTRALWDTGGIDTFDGSFRSYDLEINLSEGNFSQYGALSGMFIYDEVFIENALGGSGNDAIEGNAVANFLRGGSGLDVLYGLGGDDTLLGGIGDDTLFGGSTAWLGQAGTRFYAGAVGDFDGDGTADDVLWQSTVTGGTTLWEMENNAQVTSGQVQATMATTWKIVGLGDFDGDGKSDDVLWRRDTDGRTYVWRMEDGAKQTGGVVQATMDTAWRVVGLGDFDGDGLVDDALWKRSTDGRTYIWRMEDGVKRTGGVVQATMDTAWDVVGLGDFDGDGLVDDVLWKRSTDGRTYIWRMEDGVKETGGVIQATMDTAWDVIGLGDFDGDGLVDDVLWQRATDGRIYIWRMADGAKQTGGVIQATFGSDWQFEAMGDFDGDGLVDDVLWRNTVDGTTQIWQMANGRVANTYTGGRDVLTGGAGDDLFVFEPGDGANVVTDFTPGAGSDDTLDVTLFGYTTFAQIMATASYDGNDTTFDLGSGDSIVLTGVNSANLHADDFEGLAPTGNSQFRGPVFELSDIETGDGSLGFVLMGVSLGDLSGWSVSSAGDLNGDGLDDVIVGAMNDDPNGPNSGASFVVFGSITDITRNNGMFDLSDIENGSGRSGFVLNGMSAGDRIGKSVSSAGDVNGDGLDDIVLSTPSADPNGNFSGSSIVVFGSSADITDGSADFELWSILIGNGSMGFVLNGVSAGDASGHSASSAGDMNGDGFDDLIVGAYGDDPNGESSGSTYIVFGSATDITGGDGEFDLSDIENGNGSLGFVLNGVSAGDKSGYSVSAAGDVNGDGLDDLIVGAKSASTNGTQTGASYVVFGSATDITGGGGGLALSDIVNGDGSLGFVLNGMSGRAQSGHSVSSAGDVNGDKIDDLIIGSPYGSSGSGGGAFVVFGSATDITGGDGVFELSDIENGDGSLGFVLNGVLPGDTAGKSVSSAGDVNGDGLDDLIVGAPGADTNANLAGVSYVIFGSRTDLTGGDGVLELSDIINGDGSLGFVINGVSVGDRSGNSVSSAGDVNGDGFDDLIVGAYSSDLNGSGSGSSYILFGGNFTNSVNIVGTENADNLQGTGGDDIIIAMQGDDTITGNDGNDRMTGALGDDLFVFNNGDGDDIVVDFVAGAGTNDVLDVSAFTFANLAAVQAASSQVRDDVLITLDGDDSVTLLDVQLANLHGDDFLFV